MSKSILMCAGLVLAAATGCSAAQPSPEPTATGEATVQWSYDPESPGGPDAWGTLPGDAACAGARQSPVDIVDAEPVDRPAPRIAYRTHESALENNGHSVEAETMMGGRLVAAGRDYLLANVHFHAPSEHRIDGRQFPLEMHFVNQGMNGATVVGLLVEEGAADPAWDAYIAGAGRVPVEGDTTTAQLPLGKMLPRGFRAYEYPGSLTTPPCSPIVDWVVVSQPITMSAEQIGALTAIYSDTDRPLQPLAGRRIELTRSN